MRKQIAALSKIVITLQLLRRRPASVGTPAKPSGRTSKKFGKDKMNDHRKEMEQAIKEILVPALRERGFKGSVPHFRRVLEDRVDYLTIQFRLAGGRFIVEIAGAGADGKPAGYGKELPINKLSVPYFGHRLRLGSDKEHGKADHWFAFGPATFDRPEPLHPKEHYLGVAKSVLPFLDLQAEPWWRNNVAGVRENQTNAAEQTAAASPPVDQ